MVATHPEDAHIFNVATAPVRICNSLLGHMDTDQRCESGKVEKWKKWRVKGKRVFSGRMEEMLNLNLHFGVHP